MYMVKKKQGLKKRKQHLAAEEAAQGRRLEEL
jgi:hypothetical protein